MNHQIDSRMIMDNKLIITGVYMEFIGATTPAYARLLL